MIDIKWTQRGVYPNLMLFPITTCDVSFKGTEQFNEILDWCEQEMGPEMKMEFTPSTGMKKGKQLGKDVYGIRPSKSKSSQELIIWYHERGARIKYWQAKYLDDGTQQQISGRQAFEEFTKNCKKHGVKLTDFAENDRVKAEANKNSIEKVRIEMIKAFRGIELQGVNHLDLNSSYLSGMCVAYPQLRPAIEWMYEHRKDNVNLKSVMVASAGYFQSEWCKYKYAHLAAAGIAWNNRQIERLTQALVDSGRIIVGYNTDGIWYKGPVYHDEFEGSGLCRWKNDHKNCKFRAKSNGAYEFIDEDGVYKPIVRGSTMLDKTKPRDQWQWGDIFREDARIVDFKWNLATRRLMPVIMEEKRKWQNVNVQL